MNPNDQESTLVSGNESKSNLRLDYVIQEIKRRKKIISDIEKEIEDLRVEHDEYARACGRYVGEFGSIENVATYPRVSYDVKKVDEVLALLQNLDSPIAANLDAARKITWVASTWRVK